MDYEGGGRMNHEELLDDLDAWCMVQPRAAKAIRALLAERDELKAELIAETNRRWEGNRISQAEQDEERDALQAEIERLRDALERLACLGNGDRPGNSDGNVIAQQALTGKEAGQ